MILVLVVLHVVVLLVDDPARLTLLDPANAPPRARAGMAGLLGIGALAATSVWRRWLHLDYEHLEPYPLQFVETEGVPLSYRVEDKMRLSADKTELRVNPSLTLAGIPPEVFENLTSPPPEMEMHLVPHGGHMGFLGWDGAGGIRWAEMRIADWVTGPAPR